MVIQETGFIGPVWLRGNANGLLFTKNIKDDNWLAVWGQNGQITLNKHGWKRMDSLILIDLRYTCSKFFMEKV